MSHERLPDSPSSDPGLPQDVANLHTWERWVAGVIGLAGVVIGAIAIFATDNQAGTTVIILLGAIFMLLAVQGTPILRASKDSVEMATRRAADRVVKKASDASEMEGSQKARALIEAAGEALPEIKNDPRLRYMSSWLYEDAVLTALNRVLSEHHSGTFTRAGTPGGIDRGFDAVIHPKSSPMDSIPVGVLYSSGPKIATSRLISAKERIRAVASRGIIVANVHMSNAAAARAGFDGAESDIQFVLWRDHKDDSALLLTINRLMNSNNT